MAEFPAFPLYTDAYLGDTTHLSTTEHGAYLLLLIVAWRSKDGALSDDDRMLAKYAKLTSGQWRKIRPILAPFFTIENGLWVQERLKDEYEAVRQLSKRQSFKARSRWLKNNDRKDAGASSGQCPSDASPYKEERKKKVREEGSAGKPTEPIPSNTLPVPRDGKHESKQAGVLKNGEAEKWDVVSHLSDKGLENARRNAEGWDIYYLANIYNEGVNLRGIPDKPDAAFPAWVKLYTKEKRP